jgi:hypothetical protein
VNALSLLLRVTIALLTSIIFKPTGGFGSGRRTSEIS